MTISAKIIADSISRLDFTRITTFELEYPRFIHAEMLTHRLFSRNSASSRAIPVKSSIAQIKENMASPIHWGKNQPGMSAEEEGEAQVIIRNTPYDVQEAWRMAGESAIEFAQAFADAGYHKQLVNRILEPFSHIKVVLTGTEFANFFWLRCHKDAQPEIQTLAEAMYKAREESAPVMLGQGEWHTPYYGQGYWKPGMDESLEDALVLSASQCAQVSYRKSDDSLEKAHAIYRRLVESKPVHASPFEHQATPEISKTSSGMTHTDRDGNAWSGNFRGWKQHRQLIRDNVCLEYHHRAS